MPVMQYVYTLLFFAIRTTGQTRNIIIFIITIIASHYDATYVIFYNHQRRRHKFLIPLYVVQ
jgi:hypothetical protein